MIDISSMDDEQVRGLSRELSTTVSEKNLFVGAQFMADLEDALLEIREGIKQRLAEHVPSLPGEIEWGSTIVPGNLNRVGVKVDGIVKTGQMVLVVLNEDIGQPNIRVVLPPGIKLVKDPDRSYTGVIVKGEKVVFTPAPSTRTPPTTQGQDGRVFWSLPSNGVPEEFIRPNSYQDTELRPIWGNIEINGRMDVEAFEREVKRLLKEDKDK